MVLRVMKRASWVLAAVCGLCIAIALPAQARQRHAIVVGVSDYKAGLAKLKAPSTDADEVAKTLRAGGLDFEVSILKDDDIKDKTSFFAAIDRVLRRVQENDEVLFYFSGHGFLVPDRGNFYLLADSKSQDAYLKDLGPAGTRDLDTQEKRARRYQEWIASVAISEEEVEQRIGTRKPSVVIVIADACRSLITGGKGFVPVPSNIGANREAPSGVFRIYAASPGEVAYDAPDRVFVEGKGTEKRETSLFTSVLLREILVPNVEINQLFGSVKFKVRDLARKQLEQRQVPHYSEGRDVSSFFFRQTSSDNELRELCATAPNELAQLRFGVAQGGVSRETLQRKAAELAPCGLAGEIEMLLKFESQGTGALSTSLTQFAGQADVNDPIQQCELMASSPFDPNRAQGVTGFEIQMIVLQTLGKPVERARAQQAVQTAIAGCETAVRERNRVARFKFNLSRSYYALATLQSGGLGQAESLAQASKYAQEAVEMGYPAAYNSLALLHLDGEFFDTRGGSPRRAAPNRKIAVDLLKRGADLGHVIAQYNLGMAHKNGDLTIELASLDTGTRTDAAPTTGRREAQAFQLLSRAAEGGFVPAMVEKALMLRDGRGIADRSPNDIKAAIELLTTAASRGSWEAMYRLAEINHEYLGEASEALVWYARAAEAGDNRAQTRLAVMLTQGDGLPAQQREAAGRYWRLAADGGNIHAQMALANLLREGKIPFRPRIDGKMDGGALEVHTLYASAFARGNPEAGLQLARLFRTGFPVGNPSDVIPKDVGRAVDLLWATIREVRSADPTSGYADPRIEAQASFELIEIAKSGIRARNDGTELIAPDQLTALEEEYGDPSEKMYVLAAAVGPVVCKRIEEAEKFWVLLWNGQGSRPPNEAQFDWIERRYRCKDRLPDSKRKDEELGFTKKTRDIFKREFEAAAKDKEKDRTKKRAFVDRIVEIVTDQKPSGKR